MQIPIGWGGDMEEKQEDRCAPRGQGRKEGDLTLSTSQSSVYTGWKLFNKSNIVW